ncbi:alpha/beta hydrolase [Streptomyces sp. NPDC046203]|uniref:alpha/beta fold hydrolase n=1 Tax=Streptomyces sp. NPDC046203 TaxID=3154602 RepID=UPI0033D92C91
MGRDRPPEAPGGHRVVVLDQRGHGASERRPRDVTREAYVADILAVIDRLGLHRPVLIGQSYGGHTALLAAALAENSGRDRWEEWAAIGVPVLAVLGRRGIVSTEQYDGMAERQPARLHGVGIPDAGHDPHLEQPGVLHAAIRDFLSGIPYGLPDPR